LHFVGSKGTTPKYKINECSFKSTQGNKVLFFVSFLFASDLLITIYSLSWLNLGHFSPKLAACAAELSSPYPDYAIGYGAVCHLIASSLAFWPVHGWSPGLYHTLLASVQGTSLLTLGPKETCSLLYLLVCLFHLDFYSVNRVDAVIFLNNSHQFVVILFIKTVLFFKTCKIRLFNGLYEWFFLTYLFSIARVICFLRKIYGFGLVECLC
jgi:hypothetical protein